MEFGQIQKIYSTAWYLSLSIRSPGQTHHLYLGRGNGHEGVWVHDSPPPSELRRKDAFLEYLRRYLSSCSFVELKCDAHDRIVALCYQKFGKLQSLLLFWRGRKLYFLHHFVEGPDSPFKLLLSWRGKAAVASEDREDLFSYFDEVGRRRDMEHELSAAEALGIGELLEKELAAAKLRTATGKPHFLERKKLNIEADLRRARQWTRLQALLDQGTDLDGVYELRVEDQRIKFEGELNPFERRNLLFQKIKKLKRGEGILSARLTGVEEELAGKGGPEARVETDLPINRPVWGKEENSSRPGETPASGGGEFRVFSFEDFQVGVGTSARGNDQLRNSWAKKDDLWLHLDGLKSAHAIIKTQGIVTAEMLNTAASIVAHFSHFQADWIPVIYTPVKNLKGVTGAPGMVIYKKEKHLRCPLVQVQALKD
jgi:predicted ribosome quality control (RQC) complex YloA/Tae2 family protein